LTPWAAPAGLAPGRWQTGWELPHPSHDERAVAGRAPSISEPERPRRRHRLDLGCALSPHAVGLPLVGARGAGRAERGGDRSDGAAGRRTRARRSVSDAGCLDEVEKLVTARFGSAWSSI
jgi:hypothetical protein